MRAFYVFVGALALSLVSVAQAPQIGDTKGDVRRLMGVPEGLFSLALNKTFDPKEEVFALQAGQLDDVWEFKGLTNSFQMRATYAFDTATSRLHPAEKLLSVDFIPDKDELASTLLQQIPMSRALCLHGCDVFGSRASSFFELWVCRKSVEPSEQRVLVWASTAAGTPNPGPDLSLCSVINYGSHPEYEPLRLDLIEWKNMRVDYIRVGAENRRYLGNGNKEGVGWVRLREWTSKE